MRKSQRLRKQAAEAATQAARRHPLREEIDFFAFGPQMLKEYQPDDRPLRALSLIPGSTAQTSIVCPPNPKGSKPPSSTMRGWDAVAVRFDEGTRKAQMVRSTEIKPPIMRDFTGAVATPTGDANAMRANITAAWNWQKGNGRGI